MTLRGRRVRHALLAPSENFHGGHWTMKGFQREVRDLAASAHGSTMPYARWLTTICPAFASFTGARQDL